MPTIPLVELTTPPGCLRGLRWICRLPVGWYWNPPLVEALAARLGGACEAYGGGRLLRIVWPAHGTVVVPLEGRRAELVLLIGAPPGARRRFQAAIEALVAAGKEGSG